MIETKVVRKKILDLAVRGLLTRDYSSSVDAKEELTTIISKSIKYPKEVPFPIKKNWVWVKIGDLGADVKVPFADGPFGSNLKREHYTNEKQVRIIQLSNVGELGWKDENEKYTTYEHLETIKRSEVGAGNIVIAKMMPAGRAIIVPDISGKYVLSSDCVKFVPNEKLIAEYLCYAINSEVFRKQVLKDVHGIGRERTSLSKLKTYLLPIPPVSEQKEIVEVINMAFAILEKIDELQEKYLTNYSILKEKVIEAGIGGKLTEQKPEDGNAQELYLKLLECKADMVNKGLIKKEKPIPPVDEEEAPFLIPNTWKWVRFADLYSLSNGVASRGSVGGKPRPVLRSAMTLKNFFAEFVKKPPILP